MTEWWQVLIVAFSGGFIGGTVAWHLELRSRSARLPPEQKEEEK